MSETEARETQFRADLGSAIHKLRQGRKMTRVAFGKLVGVDRTEVSRLEVGAPELSLDVMLRAYFAAGGLIRYEFEPAVEPTPTAKPEPDEPALNAAKSTAPRKAAKSLKA